MKKTICRTLFVLLFINFGHSQNESIKSLVEKTNDLNLDMWELTTYAENHIKDKEQLARFFYYWIGSNIEYDHKTIQEDSNGTITLEEFANRQDEYEVYKNRKGVCAGYAKLFSWFLDWVDIEAVVISGHIRDERNHYVELFEEDFTHAWNAIKLNNKWLLVDSTWGTSYDESQSEFYFDIKPEFSIISHYPEESKWQLLEKPLTLKEFNNSKFIKPIWFFEGFSDIPKLKEDNIYYYFVYRSNPNKNWRVNFLYSSDNRNFKKISELERIEQDGYTYLRFHKSKIDKETFFKVNLAKSYDMKYYSTMYKDVINFKF